MPYLRPEKRASNRCEMTAGFRSCFSDWLGGPGCAFLKIVGRLLRIPVSGKPLTIMDLSGVPVRDC